MPVLCELRGLEDVLQNIRDTIAYGRSAAKKAAVYQPAGARFAEALRANAPHALGALARPAPETVPVREAITQIDGPPTIPNVLVLVDGTKAPAAAELEYGTGERYTRAGAYRGAMPARPFFRPTARVEAPGIKAAVGAGFLKEISDAMNFKGSESL